jgi:hypothetical protein
MEMETVHEDRFVLFARADRRRAVPPDAVEEPLCHCATYADARRAWQEYRSPGREGVIRYVGPAGGGD